MKIIDFGSLNVDRVYDVQDFVHAGETILSKDLNFFPGGKGLNQTIGIAKAGGNVYHAGIIGGDGGILKDCLIENHVALDYLKEMPEKAGGHAVIQINENGQNAIIVSAGTNHLIDRAFVDEVMKDIEPGDIVLVQNEISNVPYIIEEAKKAGAMVAINPSPITPELKEYPIELCDIIIVNEIEGACLTGEENPDKVLDALMKKYPQARIVLTLGGDGSCYGYKGEIIKQSIFKANAVDTTAAGDTYCGYLLTCFSEGKTPKEALEMASAASAIAVSRNGAAVSIPSRNEVEEYLKEKKNTR